MNCYYTSNFLSKKQKSEEDETQYFDNFLKDENNTDLIFLLRLYLAELTYGSSCFNVSFRRVTASNATVTKNFEYSELDLECIRNQDSQLVLVPISLFFLKGYAVLMNFLDEPAAKVPEDVAQRRALRDLLRFLRSDHSVLVKACDLQQREHKLAVRLAQHLMLPLVLHKSFVIERDPWIDSDKCCSVEHLTDGQLGDTSFGCAKGWHGHVDILLTDKQIPFTVVESSNKLEVISTSSESSTELQREGRTLSQAVSQIMAQTIVFSFLRNKESFRKGANSLIPGIGICANNLIVCLYDSQHDVLLQSLPLKLFSKVGVGALNIGTVLVLWMVLNDELFGSGVPEDFVKYKAEFHQRLGPEYLEIYRNEVKRPCENEADNDSLESDWLNEPCLVNVRNYVPEIETILLQRT